MPPRPRRSAAQRASQAITDLADRSSGMASRARRIGSDAPSADSTPSSARVSGYGKQLRQSSGLGSRRDRSASHDVVHSRRPTRGAKKRYVESDSSDEEDEVHVGGEEDDDEDIDVDDMDDDDDDDDDDDEMEKAEERDVIKVDVDMDDLDEDDAEGDIDMDVVVPVPPTIKITKPAAAAAAAAARGVGRPAGSTKAKNETTANSKIGKVAKRSPNKRGRLAGSGRKRASVDYDDEEDEEDDDDDDEEDVVSDADQTHASVHVHMEVSGEVDEEDAEGDEIEVRDVDDDEDDDDDENENDAEMDAEGDEDDAEGDSDGEEGGTGSRAETPDLTKMTRRQRARFEEPPEEEYLLKLSDEVQVKKHFTEEELSMRRAEMARRRRNLSEKRNEEVKAETINKLLKRQAPKTTKKNALGDDDADENGYTRPDPVLIRWVSNRQGSRLSVPGEVLAGPMGAVIAQGGVQMKPRKMVEEVT